VPVSLSAFFENPRKVGDYFGDATHAAAKLRENLWVDGGDIHFFKCVDALDDRSYRRDVFIQ